MRRLVWLLILLGSSTAPAWGQPLSEPLRLRLTWENDLLAGQDRHYTNGAEVSLSGPLGPDRFPALLAGPHREWEAALGQQIYTPENTAPPTPDPGDRPYAGLAYLRLGVTRRDATLETSDRLELTLGLIGPASGAAAAQRLFHRLTDSSPAEGWTHQVRHEPVLRLSYTVASRLARGHALGIDADLTADLELALGNLATHVGVGAALRVGLGVPDDYSAAGPAPLRCYLTASARVRAVGYDLLLDGNLFRSAGPSVRKQPLVAELSLGLTVTVSDRLTLSYTHTYRSPQFVGQRQGDQFGSVALTISW